jgi:hypothetical protein
MIVSILPSHHGKHDHASSLDHFTGTPSRARGLRAWNVGSATMLALLATLTLAANLSLMP